MFIKRFTGYLLICSIILIDTAPAMRSRANSLDDLGEAEQWVRSLPRSYSAGNLRSNSPVNQLLISNDQSDDSENGAFLKDISALEDETTLNSSFPTLGIISRERTDTSGSSTSGGEKQELKDPSPLSSGSRNSSPESSIESFKESFLKQAPDLFEARVEGEKAQAPVVVPPTKENIWKEIFGEFKDVKEENRGSTTTQHKKDIRKDFTEKSSLLPKNGSIQEDDWVIIGSMETQQGSFTRKSSKDNTWLSKIPLLSLCQSPKDKHHALVVSKETKEEDIESARKVGKLIIVPPETLKDLSDQAKAYLRHITQQDIEGKNMRRQWIAIGVGTFIGIGLPVAVVGVFSGGISYVQEKYKWGWLEDMEEGGPLTVALFAYIVPSVLFDAIPRNASLLKKAITYLAEESIEKSRVILTGLAAAFPSLLEPFYLIQLELHNMQVTNSHGVNNPFAIWAFVFCPFLFADSYTSNYDMAWEFCDDVKDWAQTSTSSLARYFPASLRSPISSPEELTRREFDKDLNKLAKHLYTLSEAEEDGIYQEISTVKEQIRKQFPDLEEDQLAPFQSFLTLRYLISLGKNLEEEKNRVKSWYETFTDDISYGCLVLGTPMRFLALELIFETIVGLFAPTIVSKVFGWTLATVAFPLQTGLEYQGMKNFFKDFLWHENPHGHSSHPGLRGSAKVASVVQGLTFTLPLAVLCLQVVDIWFANEWWMIMSVPFLIPEFTAQATGYHITYNRQSGTAIADVHNWVRKKRGKEPRGDYKRDKLIQLVQNSQGRLKKLPPSVIQKLKNTLGAQENLNGAYRQ